MAVQTKIGPSLKGPFESSVQRQCVLLILLVAAFTGINASTTSSIIQSSSTATRTETFATQIITQPQTEAVTNVTPSMQNNPLQSKTQSNHHPSASQTIQPRSTTRVNQPRSTTRVNQPQTTTQGHQPQTTTLNNLPQSTTQNARSHLTSHGNQRQSTTHSNQTQVIAQSIELQSISQRNQPQSTTQGNRFQPASQSNQIQSTTQNNQPQSTTQNNQPPSTTQNNQPQSTTHNNQPQSTTQNNQPQSTTQNNRPQSTTQNNQPQSTTQNNQPQSTTQNNQPQSTTQNNQPPSTTQNNQPQSTTQNNQPQSTTQNNWPQSTTQNGELHSTTQSNQARSATQSEQAQTTTQISQIQSTTQNSQPPTAQNNQIRPTTQDNQIQTTLQSDPIQSTIQSNQAQSTTQDNRVQTTIQSSQQLPITEGSHLSQNTESGLLISGESKTIQPSSTAQSSEPTSTPQSNPSQSHSSNNQQMPSATNDNLALSTEQKQDLQSSFGYQIIQETQPTLKLTASDIQPSSTFNEQNLQSILTPELVPTPTCLHFTTTESTQHAPTTQSARLSESLNSTALNTSDWLPHQPVFDSLDDKDGSYSSTQNGDPSTTYLAFSEDRTNSVFSSNSLQYHIEESNTFTTTNDGASHIAPSSIFIMVLYSSDVVSSGFEDKLSTESFLSETHPSPNTGFIIPFGTIESPIDTMFSSHSSENALSPPLSTDIYGDDRNSSIIDAYNPSFSPQDIYNATSVETGFISSSMTDDQLDVSHATSCFEDESPCIDSPGASIGPETIEIFVSDTYTIDYLDGTSEYVMESSYPSFPSIISTPPLIYIESATYSIPDESINGTTEYFENVSNSSALKTSNSMTISQTHRDTQVSLIMSSLMDEGYAPTIIDTVTADGPHTQAASVLNLWVSDGPTSATTEDPVDTPSYPFLVPSRSRTQQSDMSLIPSFDSSYTRAQTPRMEISTQSVSSTHSSIDHSQMTTTETTLVPGNKTTALRFKLKGECLVMASNESNAETLAGFLYFISNRTNGFKDTSLLDLKPCEPFNITVQIPVKIKNQTTLFEDYLVNITLIHEGHNHIFIVNIENINSGTLNGSNSVADFVITYTVSCICGVLLVLFVAFLVREAYWKNGLSSWKGALTRCRDIKTRSISLTGLPRSGSLYSEMRDNGSIAGHVTPSFGVYSTVENETEATTTSFMKKSDLRRSSGRSGKCRRSLTKKIKPSANTNGQGCQQSNDQNKRPYGLVIGLMGIKSTRDDHVYAVPKKAHKKRKVYGLAVRPTASVPKPSVDHNPRASFDSPMAMSQPIGKTLPAHRCHKHYLKHGEVKNSQENLVPGKQGGRREERRTNVESGIDNPGFDDYDSDKSTHI